MSSLFILGATGYIGGAVLLATRKAYPDFIITALIRSAEKTTAVKQAGVDEVVIGTHEDLDLVRSRAAGADIVLNAADADDLPLTKAVIAGLKLRARSKKSTDDIKPILLHTSGTGVIAEGSDGSFVDAAKKIWNDNNEDDIRSIRKTQPHRLIDLEIFRADEEGEISAYIIAPSTIYGVSRGPGNQISQQVPNLIRAALRRQQVVYVGEGTNLWNNVHIADLVELYLLVLKLALSGDDTNVSYGKFYFGSVGEHAWKDVAEALAPILSAKGLVQTTYTKSVPAKDEPTLTASNSRSVSERGFALGWKPKGKSIYETLPEDVDATISRA